MTREMEETDVISSPAFIMARFNVPTRKLDNISSFIWAIYSIASVVTPCEN